MRRILVDVELNRKEFSLKCNLDIPGKGVMAILGPSGSGKTTLLRIIAGLEKPDRGTIKVNGVQWIDVGGRTCLTPQKRKVGMVFQDYALFDHLSVAQNIAYGLPRKERKQAVNKWIKRLQLESLEERFPHELSGGQRQRVALARALAPEPDILLLDEPFSAVDASLREKLRIQLQEIVATLEQPVLLVTHDLDEARYLADYIGVMVAGQVYRFGLTNEVFNEPGSYEVAKILGWRNFLALDTISSKSVSSGWGTLSLDQEISPNTDCLSIRPYHIRIAKDEQEGVEANVVQVRELGALREMECRLNDGTLLVMQRPWRDPLLAPASKIRLHFPMQHVRALREGLPVADAIHRKKAMLVSIRDIQYANFRDAVERPADKSFPLQQERIPKCLENE